MTSHGGEHIVPANSEGPQEGHMAYGIGPKVSRAAFDNYQWVSEEKIIKKYQGTSQQKFEFVKHFGTSKFLAVGAIVLI